MTVREALDEKRKEYVGKVEELVLCKRELFYLPALREGHPDDSVYPVSDELAAKEAAFFGVPWSEQ